MSSLLSRRVQHNPPLPEKRHRGKVDCQTLLELFSLSNYISFTKVYVCVTSIDHTVAPVHRRASGTSADC